MSRDPLKQGGEKPEETVQAWQADEPRRLAPESARKTKRRPREEKRSARFMGLTLPTPAWKLYIADKARELGIRPSDLVVYCLSYAFAALESGDLTRPDGAEIEGHHRAGETLNLPWRP